MSIKDGKLYIVGIGPGHPDLMTVAAQQAILKSEYVIGNTTYLDQIEPLLPGRKVITSSMGEEIARARHALELASRGKTVSIISGGDAGVYGMAGIVLEIAEKDGAGADAKMDVEVDADTRIQVIPGVTAANSAASILGSPITSDFATISLSDLLTPWEDIEKRIAGAAASDFVIVLYNPKSRNRNTNFGRCIEIVRRYRSGSVPVGLVKNAFRDVERAVVTTLERALDYDDFVDMHTTAIIGNSESRIWGERIITPRGYHRKYDY
ncbi:MAG: precorrin-3B C(17)-methyltransferase [Candidatus Methanogaster sp.]|uniref:Precorrin-3B C(17)-methyltransferase n=1 Tax=Candidatus Methanogaster sp. TaxID=3386292 RepID=A0AC61L332_9EURY|nr:MAG: precorrin-3B C(17)-methyltransferase [ANME-2 cluster archaeon]